MNTVPDRSKNPKRQANIAYLPSNWRKMSEKQRSDWQHFPGTFADRDKEMDRRGGKW